MTKNTQLGIRIENEIKVALGQAAGVHGRSTSALAAKILTEWLKKQGWLKGQSAMDELLETTGYSGDSIWIACAARRRIRTC